MGARWVGLLQPRVWALGYYGLGFGALGYYGLGFGALGYYILGFGPWATTT